MASLRFGIASLTLFTIVSSAEASVSTTPPKPLPPPSDEIIGDPLPFSELEYKFCPDIRAISAELQQLLAEKDELQRLIAAQYAELSRLYYLLAQATTDAERQGYQCGIDSAWGLLESFQSQLADVNREIDEAWKRLEDAIKKCRRGETTE